MLTPLDTWVDASPPEAEPANETDDLGSSRFHSLIRRIEADASSRGERFAQKLSLRLALLWVSLSIALVMTRYASTALLRRFR
jgi:hypothetical protein